METKDKSRENLIEELESLRKRAEELEAQVASGAVSREEACRIEEANYSAIFNAASDAIFIIDIENAHIIDVNAKGCEMFYYPKEEMLSLSTFDLIGGEAPYDKESAVARIDKATKGEPQLFEWIARDKAGRLFWIEVNLKRAVIKGRYNLLAVVRDINERKEEEEVLRLAEFSIERSADSVLWVGPDARILYVNEKTCQSLGYSREELLNMTIHDIDPNITEEIWPGHWKRFKELGSSSFESKNRRRDGSVFPVEIRLNYLEFEGREYSAAYVRNITERKKQEEALIKRDYQLEILSRTTQHINTILEVPVIMRTVVAAAMELVVATAGSAGLYKDGHMVFTEYNEKGRLLPINYVFGPDNGTPGLVAKTMKPYISNDAQNDPQIIEKKRKNFNLYNIISVPILSKDGELLGCFEIYNKEDKQPFTPEDVFMLQGLSASAAVALDNAKLLEERKNTENELRRYHEGLEKLVRERTTELESEMSERKKTTEALLGTELQLEAILNNIPDMAWLKDRESRFIAVNEPFGRACGVAPEELVGKTDLDIWPRDLAEKYRADDREVMESGERKCVEEPLSDKENKISWLETIKTPIYNDKGQVIGTTGIARDITRRKHSEQELNKYRKKLEKLVKERTAELEDEIDEHHKAEDAREELNKELIKSNKRLKELALKDLQTGLYNHRYLSEFIEAEFYRAKRYIHPLSVIMIDIDYFKSINDAHGHRFGDMVLKQFAMHLKKLVRRYDVTIRSGGEEFLIISSGANKAKALGQAHRILEAVNMHNFGDQQQAIKLKLSVAVASYPEDIIARGVDLTELAEKILGRVKEEGGNRVFSSTDMGRRRLKHVLRKAHPQNAAVLKKKIRELTRRGRQNLIESIFAFARTIELKDHYTREHVEKTVHYSTSIAKRLKLPPEDIENIREASILHDLGKIGISDKILFKKSHLSKREYEEIKKHPQIAADIIRPIQFMHDIVPLVLHHHERWDGKGYPSGLKGEEIPIGARIISVADVYQALTSQRHYRKAFTKKAAVKMLREGSGTQFDPKVISIFLDLIKKEN